MVDDRLLRMFDKSNYSYKKNKKDRIVKAEAMILLLHSCNSSHKSVLNNYNDTLWDKLSNNIELLPQEKEFLKLKYWQEEAEAGMI